MPSFSNDVKMENTAILKEWFERVDSDKTGNIAAPQLKVLLFKLPSYFPFFPNPNLNFLFSLFGFFPDPDLFFDTIDDQRVLAVGNLEFPLSVVQQMIRMYDFDRNGTMSFEEFVALNKFLLKELLNSFFIYLLIFLQLQHAFSDLERGRGFLAPDDIYEALVKVGFSLDSPAFYTVCESFDQKKNGSFRLDGFMSLCIFLQSARNLFNSFDAAKQGRVTLDLNQFVYCGKLPSDSIPAMLPIVESEINFSILDDHDNRFLFLSFHWVSEVGSSNPSMGRFTRMLLKYTDLKRSLGERFTVEFGPNLKQISFYFDGWYISYEATIILELLPKCAYLAMVWIGSFPSKVSDTEE
ncbi:hypothetical protein HHK36_008793 [Tetracentron sinense]|uniref:EF-hand domain-containing protein n=1 Tax=Tetracentron sinense TaxID=13715 RepID=A0A834ZN83_TETSI|nr:hypothetical protein HHK36_008793 [Tetracentron sinense]